MPLQRHLTLVWTVRLVQVLRRLNQPVPHKAKVLLRLLLPATQSQAVKADQLVRLSQLP